MVQESRHGRVTIEKEPEISTDVMVSSLSRVDHDMSGRKITFENITVLVNSRNLLTSITTVMAWGMALLYKSVM
jgi:hypothetical protein